MAEGGGGGSAWQRGGVCVAEGGGSAWRRGGCAWRRGGSAIFRDFPQLITIFLQMRPACPSRVPAGGPLPSMRSRMTTHHSCSTIIFNVGTEAQQAAPPNPLWRAVPERLADHGQGPTSGRGAGVDIIVTTLPRWGWGGGGGC